MSLQEPDDLTGSLLIAHPSLRDPSFRRSILFLPRHSAEEGAIGLILNRPIPKQLDALAEGKPPGVLSQIPLYQGGPVADSHLTIVSLQWQEAASTLAFRAFPANPDGEMEIDPAWQPGLRGFLGYAGWSEGQLESEIEQNAWIIHPPNQPHIEMEDPENAWKDFMRSADPVLRFLAEAPDDPELN